MPRFLPLLLALTFALGGCQSDPYNQKRSRFLLTEDPKMKAWLDEEIQVNLRRTPVWLLNKIPKLGFERQPILLRGKAARGSTVTVNNEPMTRRELLYRYHQQHGLVIDLVDMGGRIYIRFRSRGYIELIEN